MSLKLLSVLVLIFVLSAIPFAHAQSIYTVQVASPVWGTRTIGVNIQQNPKWAHDAVLTGMQEWNQAQAWFKETYYPQGKYYNLTASSTGPVTLTFHNYSSSSVYKGLTSPRVSDGEYTSMIVVIMLLNPNPAADELDYYSSVINHELGHVLGLGHAPSNETDDLMCECLLSTPPSTISTLDLYAAHIVASGRVKVEQTIGLPSSIPYTYYVPNVPVPEFSSSPILVTCAVSALLLLSRKRRPRER